MQVQFYFLQISKYFYLCFHSGAVNGEGGETGEMCEGSLVIARWRNHSWYPAIVTGSKNGR